MPSAEPPVSTASATESAAAAAAARSAPATPYLQVDVERLERNIATMQAFCHARGIALRPHVKTHKCLPIARRQLEAGAIGLTVATLGEAHAFAELGQVSILVGYPVFLDAGAAARIRDLSDRVDLILGVDSLDGIRAIAKAVPGARVRVEVDCGLARTGVEPAAAGALGLAAVDHGLEVDGVFTFPGQGYGPGNAESAAAAEADALARAAAAFAAAGLDCPVRSGGSTPTARHVRAGTVTELRPGVYALNDAQQRAMGVAEDDLALSVQASVISTAVAGQFVIDAGSKVLAADRPGYVDGHGWLPDHPGAVFTRIWEHHGVVDTSGLDPRQWPAVGDRIRVVPNHACTAVNLVDELVARHPSGTLERWPVTARGRNS
ncbi:alanine racemase [Jatrophihabitans telluris]|uniref:Alanine racemase n=1 Tax=Jatrophihabitans telluris TaxID=2038343 RepID=A0ABY4QY98_9ACTN|nr:alanine racemase [Jatrophihabitans telluris]UQX88493.1 alanine racemase [Jatrophihabitans telluris]